jgi:hypothetical protein
MDKLQATALDIMNLALNYPPSQTEKWIVCAIAVTIFAWLFSRVGDKLDLPNLGGLHGFVIPLLGLAGLIVATAAAKVYLYAEFRSLGPLVFVIVAAVLASAVVVVPLINLYTGGNYVGTLASWFISLGAAIGLVLLVSTGFDAARTGKVSFERGAARNAETMQQVQ